MTVKDGADALAYGGAATAVATSQGVTHWLDYLPYAAAGLSIVWLIIRIYDRFHGGEK